MQKDLICGMEVDEKTAQFKTDYKGKTYYFCAPGCKKTFDSDPEKYVAGKEAPKAMPKAEAPKEMPKAEKKPWYKFW